jgi:calcineurin-like phosphoesterase family protein
MTSMMIREWNEIVMPEDTVYILGDVAFCGADKATGIMRSLNGRKILVEGNHDRKLLKHQPFRDCFVEIHTYLSVNYNGHKVVMFHYPIAEFDQMHRGAVHLHGHLHGNRSGLEHYRVRDMGMDATGQIVMSLDQAIASALTGAIKSHHDKYEV